MALWPVRGARWSTQSEAGDVDWNEESSGTEFKLCEAAFPKWFLPVDDWDRGQGLGSCDRGKKSVEKWPERAQSRALPLTGNV